jgi:PKD repeat protein
MSDWELYNSGLPDATYCNIIRPFYKEGKLRLATYSHGIWEADFKTPSRPLAQPMVDKRNSRCARDTFYFEDYSLLRHEGASWQWDFPGASYVSDASARNPKVVFGSPGAYDVALAITDATGQSSSKAVPAMVAIAADECAPDTVPGYALRLAGGSSDFASLPPLTMTTNTLTLSAWIKRDGPQPANAGLIFHRGDNGVGVGLNFGDANELRYHWDGQWWWNSGLVVPDQEWAHVALVITPQEARLYLNGQAAANSLPHPQRVLHNAWFLGADPNFDARRFSGLMEEVCIWGRALTQAEIRELRHLTKRPQDDASLLVYYQFNELEGDVLDRVGLRHALLGGSATRLVSTCPVGGGVSARGVLDQAGLYVFDPVGLELELPAQGPYAEGEVVVSRLNLPPDQLVNAEEHSRAYWIINNYGSNASFAPLANLAFANIGPVSAAQAAAPSSLLLYGREENGEGDTWVLLAPASAATAGAAGAARFAQGGEIEAFGQFVITRGEAPTSVRMEERLPYPFALYPNPIASGGILHIATTEEQPYEFALFNLQGGRLLQQGGLRGPAAIALPTLPSGTYTYRIRTSERWFYGQLVVGRTR